MLSKELAHFGVAVLSNSEILLTKSNTSVSLSKFFSLIKDRRESFIKIQKDISSQLKDITSSSIRDTKEELARPSLSALKYFLKEVSTVGNYDISFQKQLTSILNGCGFSFSIFSRKYIILYKMTSRWLNYLAKRDLYIYNLIIRIINGDHKKVARGISGPWGNLDLPMQERTFLWDNVAEETYGRRADIQKQRRYVMGLEDMDPESMKVGYYYRELRNEPYLFSDSDTESPYPHRNLLWES